ncbi:Bug family tripartite tricarboxylate transporter substrate binding protein [Planomonospora parontospora]|uniref:Bug family tripartite tricarboxylate transporter substrate binding protein n=1 Tax=Planomonospora parontospora TaxID=58119 RepID=UPI00166FB081|nr:tripartite tricarboxylate transporter substrate-binding protein [Planomonospora parontospora]GGL13702.1 C4-dicarboxylate ABC transporter substrate-binding protein [Planomonospora parontospora subsp. antibiotica]GII13887.1 C4-dicarboxylate ABC transporter substrate-binding protein [Planomonospora parontospora subsp. antibiotica]
MHRRRFFGITAGVVVAAAGCGATGGAGPPAWGRLSVIAPAARGREADRVARALASALTGDGLARTVEVGNHPGGAGAAALAALAASRTSGVPFTREGGLLVAGMPMVAGAETSGAAPLAESATPLARLVGEWAALAVSADSPLRSFEDFAARLRRDPAGLVVGGRSAGGPDHVLYGMIGKCLGVDARLLDYTGYAGAGQAVEALGGGWAAAVLVPARALAAGLASGRLRALAVSSRDRIDGIEAPTLMELEVRLEYADWRGLLGPGGMSDEDREAAVALCDRIDASPRWRELCARQGWERVYLSGGDFGQWLATETERTRGVLYELGLLGSSDTNCRAGCAIRP